MGPKIGVDMIEYDIGLEVPRARGGKKRNPNSITSIICNLPVGGSYFFRDKGAKTLRSLVSAMKYRGELSFRVCIRTVTENGVNGVRVYRRAEDASE